MLAFIIRILKRDFSNYAEESLVAMMVWKVPFSLKTWQDKSILAAIVVYIGFPIYFRWYRYGPERTKTDQIEITTESQFNKSLLKRWLF